MFKAVAAKTSEIHAQKAEFFGQYYYGEEMFREDNLGVISEMMDIYNWTEGWRIDDRDLKIKTGDVIDQYPSVFTVRTSDMKIKKIDKTIDAIMAEIQANNH